MDIRAIRLAGLMALAAAVAPSALRAQGGRPLRVIGVQGLTFGSLIPGIAVHILKSDPAGSGRFDLRGARNSQVQIQFTLPPNLQGPAGATLPLTFGSSDGGFSATESITSQTTFDPNTTSLGVLSNTGRASVFLGGSAIPGAAQRAGAYSATITLTVTYTGL
jgi:hypothetical protein